MNRRNFFGLLAAPLVAKAAPEGLSIEAVRAFDRHETWYARVEGKHMFYSRSFYSQSIPKSVAGSVCQ